MFRLFLETLQAKGREQLESVTSFSLLHFLKDRALLISKFCRFILEILSVRESVEKDRKEVWKYYVAKL